jgi:sulfatase maturation enzyme AslB (radical SAM superfamily)
LTKSCDLKGRQKLFFLQLGTTASCCKAYSEPLTAYNDLNQLIEHWNQESEQLTQGTEVASCNVCWQNETKGHQSYRQLKIGGTGEQIELYIDNACNQMCSYCSPKFSSTWQNNITKHGMFFGVSKTVRENFEIKSSIVDYKFWIDQIHQHIQQQPSNTVSVKLLGGEPLMQIKHLQKLLEFNSSRIKQLRINTNLNPSNNKFLIWLLNHVPIDKLCFDISLDATPEFNHVPRAGFDQYKFLENLALVKERQVPYKLLSVVSVLNIFDLLNFFNWTKLNQHSVECYPLNNPDCLDARLIPNQFKQQIDPTGLPNLVQDILKPSDISVDIKLFEQYNYLTEYFRRTHIDPAQTSNPLFGEYWNWLTERFT